MNPTSLKTLAASWVNGERTNSHHQPVWLSIVGLSFSLITVAVFDSLFFNRYYPLSEGWFFVYARFMQQGFLPYKDFHLFLTPFYQLIVNECVRWVGFSVFAFRCIGLVLSLMMAALIYLIALEFFSAPLAFIGTVFSMLYYQSSVVFINYDFLHFLNLFTLVGCLLLCRHFKYFNRSSGKISFPWRVVSAGILAGLAFLTKQSNGFFIVFFMGVGVVMSGWSWSRKEAITQGLWFIVGVFFSLAAMELWLLKYGLTNAFLNDAIYAGVASKGGIDSILWGWLPRLISGNRIKGLLAVFIAFGIWVAESLWNKNRRISSSVKISAFSRFVQLWMFFVLSLVAILLPYQWVRSSYAILHHFHLNNWHSLLALVGTVFGTLLALLGLFRVFSHRNPRALPLMIVGFTCIGLFIGNGTSAAIDMAGVYLPIALLVGFFLDASGHAPCSKMAVGVLGFGLLFYMCSLKYITPYEWWGLSQSDVRQVAPMSKIPELKGMELSFADDGVVLEKLVRLIKENSISTDSLYTFPHMAQLHLLTDRNPPTFAAVHWFDVASDPICLHDAQILRTFPPKVIVFLDTPEKVWTEHEKGFRNGNPCGQREIRDVLARWIDQGHYILVYKHRVPDENFLTVWIRKDSAHKNGGLVKVSDNNISWLLESIV